MFLYTLYYALILLSHRNRLEQIASCFLLVESYEFWVVSNFGNFRPNLLWQQYSKFRWLQNLRLFLFLEHLKFQKCLLCLLILQYGTLKFWWLCVGKCRYCEVFFHDLFVYQPLFYEATTPSFDSACERDRQTDRVSVCVCVCVCSGHTSMVKPIPIIGGLVSVESSLHKITSLW